MKPPDKLSKKLRVIVSLLVVGVIAFSVYVSLPHQEQNQFLKQLKDWTTELFHSLPFGENEAITPTLENSLAMVHALDVGQGESIVIETQDATVVIDTGERGQETTVLSFLQQQNIQEIDLLIMTHPHSDHMGSMSQVVKAMPVHRIVMPDLPDALVPTTKGYLDLLEAIAEKDLRISSAVPGDVYDLGQDISLTIIGPVFGERKEYDNLNDYSVISRLDAGSVSFLFTGDAESASEQALLFTGQPIKADILNVGHHGSSTSTGADFFSAVAPQAVFMSCGLDNSYGHPHREVMELFKNQGATIYRTDRDGTITFETDGTDFLVQTQEQSSFGKAA